MNLSQPFVRRPVATVLLTVGVALAGIAAFFVLPVAPLPQVDYPTISVSARLPGASPDTMATSVATPLERRLGVIAGVNEITSSSGNGSARISLQFDLTRKIDSAAREVQAAINASRVDLPATLRSNPTYRKVNPAAAPVVILALTSDTRSPGQIYEAVSNLVQQKLAQVEGVGDVEIGGGSLPAVRVELLPYALNRYGVSMEDVRAAIQAANANRPKGAVEGGGRRLQIYTGTNTTTGGRSAADYRDLVVAWRNDAPVRLRDIADVIDGVEDIHTLGLFNGQPAVIVLVTPQPDANVIETVNGVRDLLPELQAQLPRDVRLQVASDRTTSIRASLHEIEVTLLISVVLVVLVVSAFLRSARATIIPAVATVVSLLGTFGVMYLLGFSLNNLSLMALTVATGFVVDDAIVVLENTSRHIEQGMDRFRAALLGAREVGFTVLSISLSLVAVFIPLLFMGGQVGRLFREFAVTLSAAVMISLVISLTTTPMMCAWLLQPDAHERKQGRIARFFERSFARVQRAYEVSLDWALSSMTLVMLILVAVIALNGYLFLNVPKGFFPQQDTGQLNGGLRADQSISFQAMQGKLRELVDIIHRDPAVDTVVGFTGGGRAGGGFLFANLKPIGERKERGTAVIARLRPQLAQVTGVSLFLNPVQDVRMGGRQSSSTYQYTLKSDNITDLRAWATRLAEAMKGQPALTDVDTDQQENGVETFVTVDRASAARLGITARDVDNALYDAFGQRQVATIYDELNQYHVIMEVAQPYSRSPEALKDVYVPARATGTGTTTASAGSASTTTNAATASASSGSNGSNGNSNSGGNSANGSTAATTSVVNPALRDPSGGQALSATATRMVPLAAFAHFSETSAPTAVNHQDGELATTISFNLAENSTLSDAQAAIRAAEASIGMPTNVRGSFQGTARSFQASQQEQPLLIAAAVIVIYIVLGILYESLVHPITVLSTLPSAGVGAVLALLLFGMEFSIIALIGLFLLIGIVKKNAILIIDFALEAERARGAVRGRGRARGVPPALPADPHDDSRRSARCAAARHRLRRRRGAAPPARHRDHRRAHREPGADASHHAGRVHPPRSAAPAQPARARAESRRRRRHARAGRQRMMASTFRRNVAAALAFLLTACSVGPTYQRPEAPTSATFKEAEGWVPANPSDALERGPWWTLFDDATLNDLAARVEVSNQNVAAAVAAYDQARALVREQRASLFPVVNLDGGANRTRSGGATRSNYQVSLGGTWEPDVWGRLRRGVASASASAEASAADLAAARLAAQGELAVAYFNLRQADAQRALLVATIEGYRRNLQIAQNRYDAGVVARTDVLQAQTQLSNSEAELVGLERQRAQLEHAIAVLVGEAPANFSIATVSWFPHMPEIPVGVPSTLLERRPDIAAAERRVAAANEQIGIAEAAYFPSFNLAASLGQGASRLGDLFSASSTLWSVGLTAAQTLFNAGATRERVAGARAAHEEAVARYRQTVLAAFQDVEDQLAASRVLAQQEDLRRQAAEAAAAVEEQVLNRYRSGLVGYTEVVIAQATALSARRALVQLLADRQTTAVALIQSLGGGWHATTP